MIVHGGAGTIDISLSDLHQAGCRDAVATAMEVLGDGGGALDAACAAIRALEDNPVFNAGTGGALDANGDVTCDAALFRGDDLAYGAVGAVAGVRHPIDLARAVLEDGRHCLLVGPAAVDFARDAGVVLCDPTSMETDPSRSRWWFTKAEVGDTVGAVILDDHGSLVAASSTGGLLHKVAGRIGDSPIAGAGLYARPDLGGVSATGHGETFMKTVLAYQSALGLAAADDPFDHLASELDAAFTRVGGRGGLIAVLPGGRIAWARNTTHMGVAWVERAGPVQSTF